MKKRKQFRAWPLLPGGMGPCHPAPGPHSTPQTVVLELHEQRL